MWFLCSKIQNSRVSFDHLPQLMFKFCSILISFDYPDLQELTIYSCPYTVVSTPRIFPFQLSRLTTTIPGNIDPSLFASLLCPTLSTMSLRFSSWAGYEPYLQLLVKHAPQLTCLEIRWSSGVHFEDLRKVLENCTSLQKFGSDANELELLEWLPVQIKCWKIRCSAAGVNYELLNKVAGQLLRQGSLQNLEELWLVMEENAFTGSREIGEEIQKVCRKRKIKFIVGL